MTYVKHKLSVEQNEDADLMVSRGDALNYSLPGTGKTITSLEALARSGHSQALVICPPIALKMWAEEAEGWLGAKTFVLRTGGDIIPKDADFIVAPYSLASASQRSALYRRFSSGALILDEADALRRATSKRTSAVFGTRGDGAGGFIEQFDHVWPLTGSPIYRFNDDLYPTLRALYPHVLDSIGCLEYEDFIRSFCVSKRRQFHKNMPPQNVVIASANEMILRNVMRDKVKFIRRYTNSSIPPAKEREFFPSMRGISKEYADAVNNMSEQDLMKALVSQDKDEFGMQAVWQAVALAKVDGAVDHFESIYTGRPILLGVWHDSVGIAFEQALTAKGYKVKRVYGATSDKAREKARDEFNAGEIDCIVGQMQAMGVSWNLQKLSSQVMVGQDHYSPAVIEQFFKRVYRLGQQRSTTLDIVSSAHPLDKAIARMRKARAKSHSIVLD